MSEWQPVWLWQDQENGVPDADLRRILELLLDHFQLGIEKRRYNNNDVNVDYQLYHSIKG